MSKLKYLYTFIKKKIQNCTLQTKRYPYGRRFFLCGVKRLHLLIVQNSAIINHSAEKRKVKNQKWAATQLLLVKSLNGACIRVGIKNRRPKQKLTLL